MSTLFTGFSVEHETSVKIPEVLTGFKALPPCVPSLESRYLSLYCGYRSEMYLIPPSEIRKSLSRYLIVNNLM